MRTKIIDEIITVNENGNASCIQEIIYKNHDAQPLSFLGIKKICFHKDCNHFTFSKENNLIIPEIVGVKEQPYQKILQFRIPSIIPPGKSITIRLEYLWKHFRDKNRFKKIGIEFDSIADYNLTIRVNDDSFSNHLISVIDSDAPLTRDRDYVVTAEGFLRISRQHVSPNSDINIRINADIRSIPLPVVYDTGNDYSGCFSGGYCILLILHLLRDFLPFLSTLRAMGISNEDLFIIGIPYSSKEEVIEYLRHTGLKIYYIEKENYISGFNNLVENVIKQVFGHCKENNKKLLIIEDGGYAVPLIHDKFLNPAGLCVGAVEQTANRIWVDKELEQSGKLLFPVMNVAESEIKKKRESPLVAQAIIQNVNKLLEGYGTSLSRMRIGQIGFGSIGKPLALQMKSEGFDLTIFDIDEKKCRAAKRKKVPIAKNINDLINGKDLIIGCSGRELIGLHELRAADRSIFFVNATSKLKEIKYNEFIKITDKIRILRDIGTEYQLKGGRRITIRLLANGFPVNFFERSQSIPDTEIQFIPALLLASAGYLVQNQIYKPKIINTPKQIQNRIKDLMELHKETQ